MVQLSLPVLFCTAALCLLPLAVSGRDHRFRDSKTTPGTTPTTSTTGTRASTATTTVKTSSTTTSSTTAAPATTTLFSTSTTTAQTTPTTMIRRCTRAEVDGCAVEAGQNSAVCRQECGVHLSKIGENTDKLAECFEESHKEAELMHGCILDKIDGYATENDTEIFMIPQTDYSVYAHPFNVTEDPLKVAGPYKKKARAFFMQFRQFQKCVVDCLKDKTVACYARQQCGVALPAADKMAAVFDKCIPYKRDIHPSARKACNCLVTKQKVKSLTGTCPLLFPAIMNKL